MRAKRDVVGQSAERDRQPFDFFARVQGFGVLVVLPAPVFGAAGMRIAPAVVMIAFLDVGAVLEHHGHQIGGRPGAIDGRRMTLAREARQQPAMVEVGMGQEDEIEFAEVARKGRAVLLVGFPRALEHAAIDDEAAMLGLDLQARAGHFAGGAVKAQSHGHPCLVRL